MIRYGQTITWGTQSAPHAFNGVCTGYSYRMQYQRQLDTDELGENQALILHSRKAEVSFDAKILIGTGGTTNFLDLSAGAGVTLGNAAPSGAPSGSVVLARRAVQRWSLGQAATASFQGTHYPDISQSSPMVAGAIDATSFTTSGVKAVIAPGGKIFWGTSPIAVTGSVGIVHMLEITQELQLMEDEPDPTGVILGVAAGGYLRTIHLELLATGAAPAEGTTLSLSSAPANTSNYLIENVEQRFADKRGKMYSISAVWINPMGTGSGS